MQINDGHKFNTTKAIIMERGSQELCKTMKIIKKNNQIIYAFENTALRAINFLNIDMQNGIFLLSHFKLHLKA